MIQEMYSSSLRDIEEAADQVKSCILHAMVADGTLSEELAEEWAATHAVLYRKKSFFRTLSNLWHKQKEVTNGHNIIIVKLVRYAKLPSEESEESDE